MHGMLFGLREVGTVQYILCLARFVASVLCGAFSKYWLHNLVLSTISVHCFSAYRSRDECIARPGVMLFHLGGIINPSRDACQHQQLIPESEFLPPALLPVMG